MDASYVLPLRSAVPSTPEFIRYVADLGSHLDVIVVDGSPPPVFAAHHRAWKHRVRHVPPQFHTPNGKVGGVLTGVRLARHERLIVADDDVRWEPAELTRAIALLDHAAIVRPQNFFGPLPWHARWDTARTLLNRALGGDWPGTFAVRRSALLGANGYRGDVLFENLEMVRTVQAMHGQMVTPLDLYVRRLPPNARHFVAQRARQAYDEFARPARMAFFLAVLPTLALAAAFRRATIPTVLCTASVLAAEVGRRRAGGQRYFPMTSSFLAPLWLLERAVCAWLAVGSRLIFGGVRYGDCVLRDAASTPRELRARLQSHEAGDVATSAVAG